MLVEGTKGSNLLHWRHAIGRTVIVAGGGELVRRGKSGITCGCCMTHLVVVGLLLLLLLLLGGQVLGVSGCCIRDSSEHRRRRWNKR
jgi:hypothetical protein